MHFRNGHTIAGSRPWSSTEEPALSDLTAAGAACGAMVCGSAAQRPPQHELAGPREASHREGDRCGGADVNEPGSRLSSWWYAQDAARAVVAARWYFRHADALGPRTRLYGRPIVRNSGTM